MTTQRRLRIWTIVAALSASCSSCDSFSGNLYLIQGVDRTTAGLEHAIVLYGDHQWEIALGGVGGNTEPAPDFVTVRWKLKDGRAFEQKLQYASQLPKRLRDIEIYFVFDDDGTVKLAWARDDERYNSINLGKPVK